LAALKLDKEITRLDDVRVNVLVVIRAVEAKKLKEADFPPLARKVGEAEKAIETTLEVVQEVQAGCTSILKELKEKKALPGMTARLEERVGKPLGQAVNEDFPAAQKALGPLRAALEAGKLEADKAKGAGERLARLLNRLGGAQDGLQDLPGTSELITSLSEIERDQRRILTRLRLRPTRHVLALVRRKGSGHVPTGATHECAAHGCGSPPPTCHLGSRRHRSHVPQRVHG